MKTIEIGYRKFWMNRVAKSSIPERWEEVTPRQLIAIARNYLGESSEDKLLSLMCGVRKKLIRNLDTYQKLSLAEELNFITDYKPFSHFIIRRAGVLRAPKPRMQAMTFGQFVFVESYYSNWLQSQKDEDLDKFIASLYLPEGVKFQSENIAVQALIAGKVSLIMKLAISINYRLVKEFLAHAYPLIFQKSKLGAKPGSGDGWVKIMESVVGDDIINQDKYAGLQLHNVLRFISRKIKENSKR